MITIEREKFTRAAAEEMLPLAQKCWNESTIVKGETCAYYGDREFQIDPDADAYLSLEESGKLVFIVARDDGKLVGYLLGFLYHSLHHKHILCAIGDTMYLEPDFRAYTAIVADKFEKECKALKVEIIGWPTHINGPVYEFLSKIGYVGDDIVMEKRL